MKYTPSKDLVKIAESLCVAMAYESFVRPVVEAYEQEILETLQFRIARKWVELGAVDMIILDRKDSFLMEDADSAVFFAACHAARDAAGFKVEHPNECPLLKAEYLRVQAENALLQMLAEENPTLKALGGGCLTLSDRKKAIDLVLKLLAPFCSDSPEIMERHFA